MDARIKKGLAWGAGATLVMTTIMLIGKVTGIAPMPEPIPLAIAAKVLGQVPKPVLMAVAVVSHFGYGAFWAAVLARTSRDVSVWQGLGLGVALWLVMQLVVLPLVGWGVFGLEITGVPPVIAVATLVLHLVYGGIVGWGLARTEGAPTPATSAA